MLSAEDNRLLRQMAADLGELRRQMKELMGNGQPGVIEQFNRRLNALEKWRWIQTGGILVLLYLIGWLSQTLFAHWIH